MTARLSSGVFSASNWAAKSEMLLPASQGLVTLDMLVYVVVIMYILCFCTIINVYVCVCVRAPTGLKGGALCSHAPRACAAAFCHHNRELVQCVGLQTRHHVVQARGVGHLGRDRQTRTHAHKFSLFDCRP